MKAMWAVLWGCCLLLLQKEVHATRSNKSSDDDDDDLVCRCEKESENVYPKRRRHRHLANKRKNNADDGRTTVDDSLPNGLVRIDGIIVLPNTKTRCKVRDYVVNQSLFFRGIKIYTRRNRRLLRAAESGRVVLSKKDSSSNNNNYDANNNNEKELTVNHHDQHQRRMEDSEDIFPCPTALQHLLRTAPPSLAPSISQAPEDSPVPTASFVPSSLAASVEPSFAPSDSPSTLPTLTASPSTSLAPTAPSNSPVETPSTTPSTSPKPTITPAPTSLSSPTNSPAPSISPAPSTSPTITSSPTKTAAPSVLDGDNDDEEEEVVPTTSPRPSTSTRPSNTPSVSLAPTVTATPTAVRTIQAASSLSEMASLLRTAPEASKSWRLAKQPMELLLVAPMQEGAERAVVYTDSGLYIAVGYPAATTAVVANNNSNNNNGGGGMVRVLEKKQGVFVQRGDDILLETTTTMGTEGNGGGGGSSSSFGQAVALSEAGDIVVIGAPDGRSQRGRVMVFKFDFGSNTWMELGTPMDGNSPGDFFGYTVAVSHDGGVVAVGAPNLDGERPGYVAVYGYSATNSKWIQMGESFVGNESGDLAGMSIDLSSNGYVLAVGLPGKDGIGSSQTDAGSVTVLQYVNGEWYQLGQNIDGDMSYARAGTSVSLADDAKTLSVSQPGLGVAGKGSAGVIRQYQYLSAVNRWEQIGNDITGEADGDEIGQSLSLSGDGSTVAFYAGSYSGSEGKVAGRKLQEEGSSSVVGGKFAVYSMNGSSWTPFGPSIIATSVSPYYSISLGKNGASVLVGYQKHDGIGFAAAYDLESTSFADYVELSPEAQDESITCIAVIDQNSNADVDAEWTSLRNQYPLRSFCLLKPESNSGELLSIPNSLTGDNDVIIDSVTLDNGVESETSDWYDLCVLDADVENGLRKVILYIHETSSMTVESVRASHELFLEKLSLMGMSVVYAIVADQSDYISPCFDTSVQNSAPTSAPTAFTGWEQFSRVTGDLNGEHMGAAVSFADDGRLLVVGSPGANDDTGKVRVFSRVDDRWKQVGDDMHGDIPRGQFGSSVALSGDGFTVIAGAPAANQVRIYRWNDNKWKPLGSYLTASNTNFNFGHAVAINKDGTKIAVGSPDLGLEFPGTGTVEVFGHSEAYNGWRVLGKFEGVENGDNCGTSISMNPSGSVLAIGCPGRRMRSGMVTVYDINNWKRAGQEIFGSAPGDEAGTDVALSSDGKVVIVGIPNYTPESGIESAGQVKVYKYYSSSASWMQRGDTITGEFENARIGRSVDVSSDGSMIVYNDGPFLEEEFLSGSLVTVRSLSDTEKWTIVHSSIVIHTVSKWYNVDMSGDGSSVVVGFDDSTRSGVIESFSPVTLAYDPVAVSLQKSITVATNQVDEYSCVSVIDENRGHDMNAKWKLFGDTFPNRPFCLLKPVPPGTSGGLSIPVAYFDDDKNLFAHIVRDEQDQASPVDWYSVCNIGLNKKKNIHTVALFIDDSDSMTPSSVSKSLALFEERLEENGFSVVRVSGSDAEKDYITPCLTADLNGSV